jgi:hypothetical protein
LRAERNLLPGNTTEQTKLAELEGQIATLQREVESLKKRIEQLEK